jgi:hypothetical protein
VAIVPALVPQVVAVEVVVAPALQLQLQQLLQLTAAGLVRVAGHCEDRGW